MAIVYATNVSLVTYMVLQVSVCIPIVLTSCVAVLEFLASLAVENH